MHNVLFGFPKILPIRFWIKRITFEIFIINEVKIIDLDQIKLQEIFSSEYHVLFALVSSEFSSCT